MIYNVSIEHFPLFAGFTTDFPRERERFQSLRLSQGDRRLVAIECRIRNFSIVLLSERNSVSVFQDQTLIFPHPAPRTASSCS